MSKVTELLIANESKTHAEIIEMIERQLVEMRLVEFRGNVTHAAKSINLHRDTLTKKMIKYGFKK